MPSDHAHIAFKTNDAPFWRLLAWCVIAFGNLLLPIAAAGQENAQLLPTIQTCKDPALSFADASAMMTSYGWQTATSDEHKRDAARHISIGIHYNPSSDWNDDAREMNLNLPKRLGKTTFTSSMGSRFEGIQLFLRDENGLQYLLLKENVEHGSEGTLRTRARRCLIVTQPSNETQAIKLRGEKRENWIELPQSTMLHDSRSYSVDVRSKKLAPQKHHLKATELIQIEVRS